MTKNDAQTFDVTTHVLVSQHTILTDEEAEAFLNKYGIKKSQMPKISLKDKALASLGTKAGDIIRIVRKSPLQGSSDFYRVVVE